MKNNKFIKPSRQNNDNIRKKKKDKLNKRCCIENITLSSF